MNLHHRHVIIVVILLAAFLNLRVCVSQTLAPSQARTLFRIRRILEYPPQLAQWNKYTDLCFLPASPYLRITCNATSVTDLSIVGNLSAPPLSPSFSSDSLFTTLTRLPALSSLSLPSLGLWGPLPPKLRRLPHLSSLNLSSNRLSGPLPPLAFLTSLDLSANNFSGPLPASLACSPHLNYLDLSRNSLTGDLPRCATAPARTRTLTLLVSSNCLHSPNQRSDSSCGVKRKPLAAVLPRAASGGGGRVGSKGGTLGLAAGVVGGVVGGVVLFGLLLFFVFRRKNSRGGGGGRDGVKVHKPAAAVSGKAYVQVSPRTPTDARHMSQAVRIGTLGVTACRAFTLEEIEEVTNNFDPSNLISQGPRGKLYKGWLPDGSAAVVRCLKLKQKYTAESLIHYMDVISKLRHLNVVSILGHCITTSQENARANNTMYLVMEYVSNGTLRSHLTEWRKREMLKWPQRVSAVIGVARGIQFLHTVTVPGIVGNDLRIENILLDETLTAKISNYNLPILSKYKNNKGGEESPFDTVEDGDLGSIHNLEHGEQEDVYQLGVILVEIITGKPPGSQRELDALKHELQEGMTDGPKKLREITDPTIHGTFAFDSLQTLVAVTLNCLAKDQRERPSIDDILWNLQYSVQVQDGWTSSDSLSILS